MDRRTKPPSEADLIVECLQENTVQAFTQARLTPAELAAAEAHARACVGCHALILEVLRRSGTAEASVTEQIGPTSELRALPRPPLEKGTSIGRYTVLGLVGRGGMGEVYAAYDPSLDRRVALKVMRRDGPDRDERGQERLLREAQAIAKLSHPNVIVVHEVSTWEGRVFIAMEFVEGDTLADWLAERKRSWQEVLGIFLQAARGLSAAHRADLVHRDFKPQNVMVGRDGTVRVTDFGLARRTSDEPSPFTGETPSPDRSAFGPALTRTGERLGTPLYMAPEQFASGKTDARSDQFSFCVALFWALYGNHPFGGRTITEVAGNIATGRAVLPSTKVFVPARVSRILARGLNRDPATRWSSMDDLASALTRDSGRRRRLTLLTIATSVACAALVVAATRSVVRHQAICSGGSSQLSGVWELEAPGGYAALSGSRRTQVRAAIMKVGGSVAENTWQRVATSLDRYATGWLKMHHEACEATRVRAEQSEEALDLRMACLNDSLDSARALTQLLAVGDARVVQNAADAARTLDDYARCGDLMQLRSGIQPPKDPLIRREVDDLRADLKDANALFNLGQWPSAIERAEHVLREARRLDYCPLAAESLVVVANASAFNPPRAREIFEEAVALGESCSNDRVVAEAATQLCATWDSDRSERWCRLAAAALKRIRGEARIQAWLDNNIGVRRFLEGRYEDSLTYMTKALEEKKALFGPDNPDVARSLTNVGIVLGKLGRLDEALAYSDRAMAIGAHWFGPGAATVGAAHGTRGEILLRQNRLGEAEQAFQSALEIFQIADPAAPGWTADALVGLGRIALARGDFRDAVQRLERALELRALAEPSPFETAETEFALATALDHAHPGDDRAMRLARKALAAYSGQPPFELQFREVRAWLASRMPRHVRSSDRRMLAGPI